MSGLDDEHPEVLVLDSEDYRSAWRPDGGRRATTPVAHRRHVLGHAADGVVARRAPGARRRRRTLWADLVGAYRSLSPAVQRLVDPLLAVHHAGSTFDRFQADDADRARSSSSCPCVIPSCASTPRRARPGLFVNPVFTDHIEGLSRTESAALLRMLYDHIAAPEHVVRWRWRAGDVAVGTTG